MATGLVVLLLLAGRSPILSQESHLLVVVGLGGDPAYRELFHGWAGDLVGAAEERFGIPRERIVYLGERPHEAPGVMDDRSTLENVASALARLAEGAGPSDRLMIVLVGHGTGQGEKVQFNLPGPDLTPQELDVMLGAFPTQSIAVVNAASSSGPFLPALSGPNRVILTATRTAQERNETQFGGYFVEALTGDASDLDKDGRISLLEAFRYAQREVERYYETRNLLATEHAQLDDNGDGEGSTELGEVAMDGGLAREFWLEPSPRQLRESAVQDSLADPELVRLYEERAELEGRVRELRALRGRMEETRYERELEALLIELALKNREIREKGGGGS